MSKKNNRIYFSIPEKEKFLNGISNLLFFSRNSIVIFALQKTNLHHKRNVRKFAFKEL